MSRVGYSKGLSAFRTRPTRLYDKGSEYRTYAERGREDLIAAQMNVRATMVATNGSYSEDMFRTSCRIWGGLGSYAVWQKNNRLLRSVESDGITLSTMRDVFYNTRDLTEAYIPVRWWSRDRCYLCDVSEARIFALHLLEVSGRISIPMRTFALQEDKNGWVLYARRSFLEMFTIGLNIINAYNYMLRTFRDKNKRRKHGRF